MNLPAHINKRIEDFKLKLEDTYKDGLVSVIIYGSAASGEFLNRHSNINLLIVLKNTGLENLDKVSAIINSYKFRMFNPVFITEEYLRDSSDVFPIEFLDMKENYLVSLGKDVLKDLVIDPKNLRFQCEQELKAKLLNLKTVFLRNKNSPALRNILFKAVTSTLHVARNLLRLRGKTPPYKKEEILQSLVKEFSVGTGAASRILEIKNKNLKLNYRETERLFFDFAAELEKIADLTDGL